MSNASPRPTEAKQFDKDFWKKRVEQLKQQLTERRTLNSVAQAENMSSSQITPEKMQRKDQPPSDQAGSTQVKTSAFAQAQSNPGPPHQLPDDKGTLKETSQLTTPSVPSAPEKSMPNASAPCSAALTGEVMEKPSPSLPSKMTGNDTNDTLLVGKGAQCDANAPSSTNGQAAITVPEKIEDSAHGKLQQRDDGTPNKEQPAPRNTTKSMANPQNESNEKSSTEEGEIKSRPCVAHDQKPTQEPTPQHASSKMTTPSRVSTSTSKVPVKIHPERRVSGPFEATPAPKYKGAQAATGPTRSSTSRSEGGSRYRRASSPVRVHRTGCDDRITWESYEAPPLEHHAYQRASREPRHRSASPAGRMLMDGRDREVERLASCYPDLQDWLEYTGWNILDYRMRELDRTRRLAEIEREKSQLERASDLDKARLKESGEPAGKSTYPSNPGSRPFPLPREITRQAGGFERPNHRYIGPYPVTDGLKRKRNEESEDDRDGGSSPKYYRANRNHRGSRAGNRSSRGSHQRGHEESGHWQDRERRRGGRSPPPRGFPEHSPSRSLHQRNSRVAYSPPGPAGRALVRNGAEAELATDRYMTRDKLPARHLSPRFSSSPPRVRSYF